MKHPPDIQRVIERMQPGAITLHGFLGPDRRDLEEILQADRAAVAGLGLTHAVLADALHDALERASAGLGVQVRVSEHVHASYFGVRGITACPWADGMFDKGEVTLVDERSGQTMRFSPLSVHLIAAHGFYGGKGTRFRVEPAVLKSMLNLSTAT